MKATKEVSKEEFWRSHVEAGLQHPDGVPSYCESEDINVNTFYSWKSKFRKNLVSPKKKRSPFTPVTVIEPKKELPSPEWLARFLKEFIGGAV